MPFSTRNLNRPRLLIAVILGLLLVCALGAAGYYFWINQPPTATAESICAQPSQTVEPSVPWRFQRDPEDVGLKDRWFDPSFDDTQWEQSSPGKPWYPDYDGVAWYRATFAPPASWGKAYLGVSEVDDTGQLWINGVDLNWVPPTDDGVQVIEVPVGQPLQLSFRIVNNGGPGGIKQPVLVGDNPSAILSPDAYSRWLAKSHPDWPLPGWTRKDYYAWTFTGVPGFENKALVASDGAVAPWPTAPNVSLWLYDPDSHELSLPKPVFSLIDGFLPIPQAEWKAAGLTVRMKLFKTLGDGASHLQANLSNDTGQPRTAKLFAVVRPLAFNPALRPSYAAGFDGRGRLWIDGQPYMQASPKPAQSGAGSLGEVIDAVKSGSVPKAQNLPCAPLGDAATASAFDIQLQPGEVFRLSLDFPLEPGAPFPQKVVDENGVDATRKLWEASVGSPSIVIPDQTVMDGYKASLGYLLLAQTPSGPHPGPLEHAKLWVRDAAFMGEALLSVGQGAIVNEYLPKLFANQAADGRIPPIIAQDGPEPVDEWDSQGEAIFLVANMYRYNRDLSFLRRWEPNIKNAAQFLRTLRARTQNDPPATRGLLPPSKSAEDLGRPEWHHYWDDFWAVAGLEEAAFIETELDHADDAIWMRAEANALRQAIRASVENVMGANPEYIPGAPEDRESSAMARGTSVSLYPVEVFPLDDPLVTRSFKFYYSKWIGPNAGAYAHLWGQFWPYGGLGLARDYLRLGKQDNVHQILAWTLSHQTLPGTYAWAEQISPQNYGITGGDMPHGWAAATYIMLLREMLVMRSGDKLELFAGVPPSWLAAGKTVGVRAAPTEFGSLTALVDSDIDTSASSWQGTLTLTISGSAQPAGGFSWKLPRVPASVDGPPGTEIRDGRLIVPPAGGTVKLRYTAKP